MNHIAQNVAARFVSASQSFQVGDLLTVWMKKGDWWTEMRRGAGLKVTKVEGAHVWLSDGNSMSGGFEMQVVQGPDANGRYKLDATGEWKTRLRRALVVTKDTDSS